MMASEVSPLHPCTHSLLHYVYFYTGSKRTGQDGYWKPWAYSALINLDSMVTIKRCNSFYVLLLMTYFFKSLYPKLLGFSLFSLFCNFTMICLVTGLFKIYCASVLSLFFYSGNLYYPCLRINLILLYW